MIHPAFLVNSLLRYNIDFYAGVPDSLLKDLCAYLTDHSEKKNSVIAANEGAAMGLAAGHYLASGEIPVVYMQNSGLGNTVNPLLSLTDEEVYNIPTLLFVGWRGEPGKKDEPQHVKQGKVTLPLLEAMGIRYMIMADEESVLSQQLEEAVAYMNETKRAFAFVVRKGTFESYKLQKNEDNGCELKREEAIGLVANALPDEAVVISTTGMISRELFEYRAQNGEGHNRDFLTVGSMGHASQIALGIALHQPNRPVYCFDGDGAVLMHMGSLAIVGRMAGNRYVHVVFNNGAHDSVGGQPTVGLQICLPEIAKACGYQSVYTISTKDELHDVLAQLQEVKGPVLLEIKVCKGARKNLGRPTTTPIQNKNNFMNYLKKEINDN